MTELHQLILSKLSSADQAQLRSRLDREAIHLYCRTRRGVKTYPTRAFYSLMDTFGGDFAYLDEKAQPIILKLRPDASRAEELRNQYPAIRLAEARKGDQDRGWNEVTLDGSVPAPIILDLIDHSYEHVVSLLDDRERYWLSLMDDQPIDESKIRQLIDYEGLSPHTDKILGLIRPALHLKTTAVPDFDVAPGQSKFGGRPDFPPGLEWPTYDGKPMAFLAQINMAELPDWAGRNELPATGILYVFSAYGWSLDLPVEKWGDPDISRVIVYEGDLSSLKRQPFSKVMPDQGRYESAKIDFAPHLSLPDAYSYERDSLITDLHFNAEEQEKLNNTLYGMEMLLDDLYEYDALHQLLGCDRPIQGAMIYPGERLLLQIGSDQHKTGFMWGDVGMLYFIISEDDLKAHRFDRIRFETQDY